MALPIPRNASLIAGIILTLAGMYLLWDAYEGRGIPPPFIRKFLPGM